jgi:regulatory protein
LVSPRKKKREKSTQGKSEIEEAKNLAFRFLSYRPRSVEEVRRKLKENNFSPLTITHTLARVEELGYLNDREYAHWFARSSLEHKQWGTERIEDALDIKGISREVITHTIAKLKKNYDLTQIARRALDAKFHHLSLTDRSLKKRAINYLRRKGFCWDIVFSVIKPSEGFIE